MTLPALTLDMDHFIISLLATCLSTFVIGLAQADCSSWTKEAEDNICALVTNNDLAFCSSPGAADGNCTNVTAAVSGSDPQCVDTQVCQFSLNGGTAYVSCNATKPGYEISKNCVKNFGIACPKTSADLSGEELSIPYLTSLYLAFLLELVLSCKTRQVFWVEASEKISSKKMLKIIECTIKICCAFRFILSHKE